MIFSLPLDDLAIGCRAVFSRERSTTRPSPEDNDQEDGRHIQVRPGA
jgi:hypothetical protein